LSRRATREIVHDLTEAAKLSGRSQREIRRGVGARPDVSRCRTRTVVGVDAEAGCRDIETAKSPAELMVGGLSAGERWIRTIGTCKISYRFKTDI
jgi:hypothetical protein